jgi:hypothetical protein
VVLVRKGWVLRRGIGRGGEGKGMGVGMCYVREHDLVFVWEKWSLYCIRRGSGTVDVVDILATMDAIITTDDIIMVIYENHILIRRN